MTLCLYDGSDVQREEKKAILKMLKELDSKTYLVITSCYYNRPNNPPMPVFIQKLEGKDSSCIFFVEDGSCCHILSYMRIAISTKIANYSCAGIMVCNIII